MKSINFANLLIFYSVYSQIFIVFTQNIGYEPVKLIFIALKKQAKNA